MFKKIVIATVVLASFGTCAKMPALFNAHASIGDLHIEKDNAWLNGKPIKFKKVNENYYSAKTAKGETIEMSIDSEGNPSASWTGKHRANGIFLPQDGGE